MEGLTAPRIGFSTLSLLLAGSAGPHGPEKVRKFAESNGMGYQLVMQRYWTPLKLEEDPPNLW